jgi:V/A-type H+-transporting ATPase subunit D
MELSRLKKQLQLSVRGHKLLKDKQDELMRRFVALVRENDKLRASVEERLIRVRTAGLLAKAAYPDEPVLANGIFDEPSVHVKVDTVNMMGLHVPQMQFDIRGAEQKGFFASSPGLRQAGADMDALLPDLLRLAQLEKTVVMLAGEIEKIRRRVNALEYLTIPQLTETIRFIKMRLEDAERDRITRLIKMEDMDPELAL